MSTSSDERIDEDEHESDDMLGSGSSDDEFLYQYIITLIPLCIRREPVPRNTSRFPGNDWVREILRGSDNRFYDNARMTKPCLYAFVEELMSRGGLIQGQNARVSVVEEVMLFMRIISMHHRQRNSGECFQHSLETIHRHIHRVLDSMLQIAPFYLVSPNFSVAPSKILQSTDFYPYFEVKYHPITYIYISIVYFSDFI